MSKGSIHYISNTSGAMDPVFVPEGYKIEFIEYSGPMSQGFSTPYRLVKKEENKTVKKYKKKPIVIEAQEWTGQQGLLKTPEYYIYEDEEIE